MLAIESRQRLSVLVGANKKRSTPLKNYSNLDCLQKQIPLSVDLPSAQALRERSKKLK